MSRGIIFFGAMGVGDTTLGKEVARLLNYTHVDLDNHHWKWDTEIPYTVFHSRDERTESIMQAISNTSNFVMSGSMWSLRKTFEPFFELAVFMTAPVEICAERIRIRALLQWGNRVLPGGDMYESNDIYKDYIATAQSYEKDVSPKICRAQHEQWIRELPCPVLRVDGTQSISDNAVFAIAQYKMILDGHPICAS